MNRKIFIPALLLGLAASFPAGAAPTEPADLCVESVQPPQGLMPGQTGQVVVRLSNRGGTPVPAARLVLLVDGEPAGELKVNQPLLPLAHGEYNLPWAPKTAGRHALRVEATSTGPDSDPRNNSAELSAAVGEKLQDGELHLTNLEVSDDDIPRGLPVAISFTADNAGDREIHRFDATLFEDKQKVMTKTFYTKLPGQSSKDYQLVWLPHKGGKYQLSLVLGPRAVAPDAKTRGGSFKSRSVSVTEREGFRLEISKIDVPKQGKLDQEMIAEVVVRNAGELDASDVKVVMVAGEGRISSSRADVVKAGQEGHFEVRWIPKQTGQSTLRFSVGGLGRASDRTHRIEKLTTVDIKP